jgi:hypothetical protein
MKQTFDFSVPVPANQVPAEALARVQASLNRAIALDVHMTHGELTLGESTLQLRIQYEGQDRWWISNRVKFAMIALLARSKIPPATMRVQSVNTDPNKKHLKKPLRHPNAGPKSRQRRWQERQIALQSEPPPAPHMPSPTP